MSRRSERVVAFGAALAVATGAAAPAWGHGATERTSVGPGGAEGNGESLHPTLSAHGRFVAFESGATNLVSGDTNNAVDIFVRDRRAGTTRRVSVGPGGVQANGSSSSPAISADGRFVAFESSSTNLVPGDTNGVTDVFVRDCRTGTTWRVSLGPGGAQGNGDSNSAAISADGRVVAFISAASNLVRGDTNGADDVFVRGRQAGTTRRVSVGSSDAQGNERSAALALSADGRFIAFTSFASNLVPGDTNLTEDVFIRDSELRTTRRVSMGPGGVEADRGSFDPALSADGFFVAFSSAATNLAPGDINAAADVFVRDRKAGMTRLISVGLGGVQADSVSFLPALSGGGRFVAFESFATDLVRGDNNGARDVFVRDRHAGTTRRVSVGPGGAQGNGESEDPAISADGRFIAFTSLASNLVPGDTNGVPDVFVRFLPRD